MSIAGSPLGDAWKTSRSSSAWTSSSQSVGGLRTGVMGGGCKGSPQCERILRMGHGSVMKAICRPETVEPHEDQRIAPAVRIPLIPTIAFFLERLGVEYDAAMGVLRDAITEAMKEKINESPSIKSKVDDVAEAVATVMRDLIGDLPKMRWAGRTGVSHPQVAVNKLTPIVEPCFARTGGDVDAFEESSNRYLYPSFRR